MSSFISRARTFIGRPEIGIEYARWSWQKRLLRRQPTRRIGDVTLGGFNSFSEYHTVAATFSDLERSFLSNVMLADGAIIDVGANFGLFSLLVADREPSRRILALEPNSSTFAALAANIARNNRENVECFQLAIADHDGLVNFDCKEHARANAAISVEEELHSSVACQTLDAFCEHQQISNIALLKVDVEGFESLAFKGARRTLIGRRPALIFFEVCPVLAKAAGFGAADAVRLLVEHGYRLSRFGPAGTLEDAGPDNVAEIAGFENWIAAPITGEA